MRCDEIMKKNIECVTEGDSVKTAARMMRDENIGFLPVCDDAKKVLGTVTDRDLTCRVLAEDGRDGTTKISDVMTREVVSCKPEDDLRRAEELLASYKKSRIMCVDDAGKLVGIISLSDIAQRDSGDHVARTLKNVTKREASASQ